MQVPHFEEPGRINRDFSNSSNFWMSPEMFGAVLDRVVLTCVDLVFVHRTAVLIGKRNRYPIHGWWVIGGRMFAGESPLQAVQRKAREEAGVDIGRSRIHYLGVYSTSFATRHQEPTQNGLHSVNLTHYIELTDVEKETLSLTSTEYTTWAWVTPDEMSTLLNPDRVLDQTLHHILNDLWQALLKTNFYTSFEF